MLRTLVFAFLVCVASSVGRDQGKDTCSESDGQSCGTPASNLGTVLVQLRSRSFRSEQSLSGPVSPSTIMSGDIIQLSTSGGAYAAIGHDGSLRRGAADGRHQRMIIERADGGSDAITVGSTVYISGWTGKHITAQSNGVLHAKWDHRGQWQKINVERRGGGMNGNISDGDSVVLRTWTGKYLGTKGGNITLREQNGTDLEQVFVISHAEVSPVIQVGNGLKSGDSIWLRTNGDHTLTAMPDGTVHSMWNHRGEWEKFKISRTDRKTGLIFSDDPVYLSTWSGKQVTVADGEVHSKWDHKGVWETLVVERYEGAGVVRDGDQVAFQAWTGAYLEFDGATSRAKFLTRNGGTPVWNKGRKVLLTVEKVPDPPRIKVLPPASTDSDLQSEASGKYSSRNPQADARFLMQATFGPTKIALAEVEKTSYEDWIVNQMSIPPGFHRTYFRERSNPRSHGSPPLDAEVGLQRHACRKGSRWNAFALSWADEGKSIRVQGNRLYVSDDFRTDIDPKFGGNRLSTPKNCTDVASSWWKKRGITCAAKAHTMTWQCGLAEHFVKDNLCQQTCFDQGFGYDGDDCSSGWADSDFEGYVCRVDETVGGMILLSPKDDCTSEFRAMRNPAVWVASGGPSESNSVRFAVLRNDVVIQQDDSDPCPKEPFIRSRVEAPGQSQVYAHDPRLELLDGTPSTAPTSEAGTCHSVPRTFLNEDTCELVRGCTEQRIHSAELVLNEGAFEKFHNVGKRYVYSVVDLRPTSPPCGTLSRWKLLNCSIDDCTAAAGISIEDAAEIATTLQEQVDAGSLRDIDAECANVPVGATVKVGMDMFFKHVHLHEYNVYDFTNWVDKHPGGKQQITQWVRMGYQLHYPDHHMMTRWESGLAAETIGNAFLGKIGQTVDFLDLPQSLQSQAVAEAFGASAPSSGLFESCGSPGEVKNVPELGHQVPMYTVFNGGSYTWHDYNIEVPMDKYYKPVRWFRGHHTVWINKALYSDDQLRQRVAWALSQIFVTGIPGYGNQQFGEMWVNYYDIFVRHATSNLRDVLKEVTYSPVMGEYLTYKRNWAFDKGNRFPDENYAREIMQLFTIGLWKLNDDGTKLLVDGEGVPTYTNDHIMNFARVFTGFDEQPPRMNLEKMNGNQNKIDPMRIHAAWHDMYPKPDLDGEFLGDGYPACSDLPANAFLSEGAEYHYLGENHDTAGVLVLETASSLFSALCDGSGGACNFKLRTKLTATFECHRQECKVDVPKIVKVDMGYFEYVPPACVHLFFFSGFEIAQGDRRFNWKRVCADPSTWSAGTSCCDAQGDPQHLCGHPQERVRYSRAQETCKSLGVSVCDRRLMESNHCEFGEMKVWTPTPCGTKVHVESDGRVSSILDHVAKQNLFTVGWNDGFPTVSEGVCPEDCEPRDGACECEAAVKIDKVFDAVPSKSDALAKLKLGAFPTSSCTQNCAGEVKVYGQAGGSIDAESVFEIDQKFYANWQSLVHVGKFSFRNPPVFMHPGHPTEREAAAEVDSLLDHLFQHQNTPVFISHRLIQRLVTSNPSPSYVQEVVKAFKTGRHGDLEFSGKYGDLASTVSAILLHPEARSQTSDTGGALREPLVKLIHFFRAMEYADAKGKDRQVLIRDLSDVIGQFPYMSPSVFNFYRADYRPDRLQQDLVAPEFQIFTPPMAIGFLNAAMQVVESGLSNCDDGIGATARDCKNGEFGYKGGENASVAAMVDELDLLLTGGRLGPSKDIVRKAGETGGLKAAQEAILFTPEFHTIGDTRPAGTRTSRSQPSLHEPRSYKATVMLFFDGGADTFNMLVPMQCPLYEEYAEVRQNVALIPEHLLEISTPNQACKTFGIHPKLAFVKELYDQKKAGFVANIGSLVEPMTKEQFKMGGAARCVGLFSHSDQQQAAQTLECQTSGSSPKGVGGRMADALANGPQGLRTSSFSVDGTTTWPQGFKTRPEIIDKRSGSTRLKRYDEFQSIIGNITSRMHGSAIAEEYTISFADAIESSESLGTFLQDVELKTSYEDKTSLSQQFKQVARLIATKEKRQVERDFFFVSLGGFDTHRSVANSLADRFEEVDSALRGFVAELVAQDVFESTVLVSHSDFGRTLTPNSGAGTDHAWAGNHIIIGGGINGGQVLNEFPASLLEDSEQDAGRGRLIPKYPWESVMAPIANWMGATRSQLAEIFPNIHNFNASSHLIQQNIIFGMPA